MTKKELLKHLDAGPVRCKINGELRQLTRKAANSAQKAAYKSLDEGSNIGVWDMGLAKIVSIQNKEIETVIGQGLNCEPSGGADADTSGSVDDFQTGEMAGKQEDSDNNPAR